MEHPTAFDQLDEARFWPERKLMHGNREIYMCRHCPAAFIRPSDLIKHITKKHEEKINMPRSQKVQA